MNLLGSDLCKPLRLPGRFFLHFREFFVELQIDLAKVPADLFESRMQSRQRTQGLLHLPVQIPNFVVRLRLSFVRFAQARFLSIQFF